MKHWRLVVVGVGILHLGIHLFIQSVKKKLLRANYVLGCES